VVAKRALAALAGACVLGFAATLLVALHTSRGLRYDDALFRHVSGTVEPVKTAGRRVLLGIDVGSIALATALLAASAVVRGRLDRALASVAVVGLSVGTAEALKYGLPHVDGVVSAGRPPTIPSGHASVAASLGLALVLAAPPLLRPTAAVIGAAYAAAVGLAVIVLGWHYPADVVAAFFVCGFWAAVAGAVLGTEPRRPDVSAAGVALAAVASAAALLVAAVVAGRHPAAVEAARSARSALATGALLSILSLTMFAAFLPLVGERRA
jgi:membrane-associated phospholipid phosphatase